MKSKDEQISTWISATVASLTMLSPPFFVSSSVSIREVSSDIVGNGIVFSFVFVTIVLAVILAVSSIGGMITRRNMELSFIPFISSPEHIEEQRMFSDSPTKASKQQGHVACTSLELNIISAEIPVMTFCACSLTSLSGSWMNIDNNESGTVYMA